MKEIGGMMLKLVSILTVVVGAVVTVVGLFFLQDNMFSIEYSTQTKLMTLLWIFVMCSGVAYGFFGFYGAVNAMDYNDTDANKKCLIYGFIMLAICMVGLVLVSMFLNVMAVMTLIVIGIPLLLAALYLCGTLIKIQGIKKEQ